MEGYAFWFNQCTARAIYETLDEKLFIRCLVYIDDICIFSKTFEDHLDDIEKVFAKLDKFNWKLKLKKCQFAQGKIQYLGHVISQNQIEVHPKNIDKIKLLKRPSCIKDIQAFLGSINYYRRFIPNLSEMTQPLIINLRGKNKEFIWNEVQDKAYLQILDHLCKFPILRMPDYNKPFILRTDASQVGFGGMLAQEIDGITHPISYFSGSFSERQREKWNHWHKEAFAVISGIKRYDHYLKPKEFKLFTDNESLLTLIKPPKAIKTAMIDRWGVFLQQYKYTLHHIPGKKLYIEDALSRSTNFYAVTIDSLAQEQSLDPRIKILNLLIQNPKFMPTNEIDEKAFEEVKIWIPKMKFVIENEKLYLLDDSKNETILRIVIPQQLESNIISDYHCTPISGHLGVEKTFDKMKQHVWFPDMHQKISKFKSECETCLKNKKFISRNDQLHPIVAVRPFEMLQLDHCGPFPRTSNGHQYVLTIVDHFSRKRWFIPTKSTDAKEVAMALIEHIIGPFEVPKTILTDQGSAFTSTISKELTKFVNIVPTYAEPGQHDTMGSVERSNQILEEILKNYINKESQDDWDIYLPLAAHAINKAKSESHKYSPDFLVFGRKTINPFLEENQTEINLDQYIDKLVKNIVQATELAQKTLQDYRNRMVNQVADKIKNPKFKINDLVYLEKPPEAFIKGLSRKLDNRAIGPYRIVRIDPDKGNVEIKIAPNTTKLVKLKNISLSNDQNLDTSYLDAYQETNPLILPTKFNEIIILNNPTNFPKSENEKMEDKVLEVRNLVGKRVKIYWPSICKGWHKAIIIGFNSDLTKSLIYYDSRDLDIDPAIDYYSENLLTGKVKWELL